MYNKILIKQDVFKTCISDFKKISTDLGSIKKEMENTTSSLLKNWDGKSKLAFQVEYDILKKNLGGYEELLLEMCNALESISTGFDSVDSSLASIMEV